MSISTLWSVRKKMMSMDMRDYPPLHAGVDPGFQVRGDALLKKIALSGGRRENVGVFRVKNHDFTQKNHIFSNFRVARAVCAPSPPLNPPPTRISPSTFRHKLKLRNSAVIVVLHFSHTNDDGHVGHFKFWAKKVFEGPSWSWSIIVGFTTTCATSVYHH